MCIGEQIKNYRKTEGLTQEQVANYLGVSTPAVNKWEKGNTYPDISLLPALARLLKIDMNELFSFREELTEKEIGQFVNELSEVSLDSFTEAFEMASRKIQEYPHCDLLIYTIATVLNGSLTLSDLNDEERMEYNTAIIEWLERTADSQDERVRNLSVFILATKYVQMEKYEEAKAKEHTTMIRARQIAASLNLDMKIGDVEYQGDGNKAIFYYIADERVDFRQLIKVLAEAFRVRIEMKQIGARQEAGRIGGIGPCGRELCCATWMTSFVSVSTSAARYQDISLNPQKLAGQCAKLKCCLNYEVDCYVEAQKRLPSREIELETKDGTYYFFKADILSNQISYSTDKNFAANLVTISGKRAFEVIGLNKRGIKPDSLLEAERKPEPKKPVDLLEQESLTRFDRDRRRNAKDGNGKDEGGNGNRKKKKKNNNNRPQQAANGETQSSQSTPINAQENNGSQPVQNQQRTRGERPKNNNRNNNQPRKNNESREPRNNENRETRKNEPREQRPPREPRGPRNNEQPKRIEKAQENEKPAQE